MAEVLWADTGDGGGPVPCPVDKVPAISGAQSVVVVITGDEHAYIRPCDVCTTPSHQGNDYEPCAPHPFQTTGPVEDYSYYLADSGGTPLTKIIDNGLYGGLLDLYDLTGASVCPGGGPGVLVRVYVVNAAGEEYAASTVIPLDVYGICPP